ncbi:Nucleoid occlusion protein [Planctomycetes bacterium Poly30]|uniref:Nucleoid occlusion protein n=1 Tax=Saltatorellus ferox TaxID=2528018 RepID=A0A518EN11_9BACT|nr:Nucleoid occlusion protein [Planctomycetes bacterium Poly30]
MTGWKGSTGTSRFPRGRSVPIIPRPFRRSPLPKKETPVIVTARKLSEVKLNNEYLRVDTDVSALKKSLESVGLINPVTVNLENELLAGARRFQAVSELGWEEIPVQVVDRDELVQELISIDENLVRAPLNHLQLEKCLNRGRELYESLHPTANKVDLSAEEPTGEEKQKQKELDEQDEDSFAAITAEKTGLSKSVIKGAIKRDALASDAVKKARGAGELNATKTNEIIKLDKEKQEEILPLIADKTVKETRKIVAAAKAGGVEAAVEVSAQVVPLPREYSQILSPVKRVNKNITRILVEELRYDGPERKKINEELRQLRDNLVQYFETIGAGE